MSQLKQLLVATDFSESSLHAIDRGFLIASAGGANYTIVHALGLDALDPLRELIGDRTATISDRVMDEAREALVQIAGDPTRNRGIMAAIHLEAGLAQTNVPNYATAINADLILAGAQGSASWQRFLLGSTASRLLRKSKCPVLLVKQAARQAYRRALVAVDFSPGSDQALRIAREVAPQATFVLLHIFDVPFEGKLQYAGVTEDVIHKYRIEARDRAMRQLHQAAANAGIAADDYTALVLHGDATRQIVAQEEEYDCDLIVMGKHGTHITEELLLGSVTKRVLAESRSDVLVIVDERIPLEVRRGAH